MIRGTKFWSDKDKYYTQTNNPTEEMLRKRLPKGPDGVVSGIFESCGPTAAVNCLASLGANIVVKTPGGFEPQPEEVLTGYFNDPRNYDALRKVGTGIDPAALPGNEVAAWYPLAVKAVFGAICQFVGKLDFEMAAKTVYNGSAIQVCMKIPGHFVALVAYDDEKKEFVINDSWGGRFSDGNGFNRRMTKDEFLSNVKPLCLIYPKL